MQYRGGAETRQPTGLLSNNQLHLLENIAEFLTFLAVEIL